jgi:hypothetical protein
MIFSFFTLRVTKQLLLVFVTLLTIQASVVAQNAGRISGIVINKATQLPLQNVSVSLSGTTRGTVTDSAGVFKLTNIKLGTYNIDYSLIGFKTQTSFNIIVNAGNENNFTIELETQAEALNEVTIKANRRTAKAATLETPLSVQRMTTEEIKANPGGNFDISKVIQTLPGVGGGQSGGGFRNDIIIRGGAPNENVFYLDAIEIPVINHFQTQGSSGGPQGILNVSFIEDVKLSSSAFDARYDNAMSSVFQFKQKNGNPNKLQGNVRLSATEVAATLEGPLAKNKKTTFLASARRSYLQLLFEAIDLPIRPNFWDFQTKVTHQINKKTTVSFIGLAGIDEFSFAEVKKATPEKLYIINSNPIINQWNYTVGLSLKRLIKNGFLNVALSRNAFQNDIEQFEDNKLKLPSQQTLKLNSNETENKFRIDVNKTVNNWKIAYGATAQLAEFTNNTYSVIRKQLTDNFGNIIQPATIVNFISPLKNLGKFGAFAQVSKRVFDNRVGLSMGIRTDINTFTTNGTNPLNTLSPRLNASYVLADKWTLNASVGRYAKLAPYTILGFADNAGNLVNKNADYLISNHYATGVEYLPSSTLRFTVEGFYKQYSNVPVSVRQGISLSNLGSNFDVLGNEAVTTNGKGRAYGIEFFAQKKLTKRFFGILSYTFYKSEYSGANQQYLPSSWDNQHLLSVTWGYKFPRNWELGLKFRYQGAAPFTPFDDVASRTNFLSRGQGILNYALLNSQRLTGFHNSDVRIDKKWNFKKTTIDLFLDVTNWYGAKNTQAPDYTFKRNVDNTAFLTTDGNALAPNGSNGIPILLQNNDVQITPTIGFIIEF